MQMREEQLLEGPYGQRDMALLRHLRDGAREIALGSLDVTTWGSNRSRLFGWLEAIMGDIAQAPRRLPSRCRIFKGA